MKFNLHIHAPRAKPPLTETVIGSIAPDVSRRRQSKYEPIYAQMSLLKPGEGLTLKATNKAEAAYLQRRLCGCLKVSKTRVVRATAPAGYHFSFRLEDHALVIFLSPYRKDRHAESRVP